MKKEINWKAQYVVFEEMLPAGITSPSFLCYKTIPKLLCIAGVVAVTTPPSFPPPAVSPVYIAIRSNNRLTKTV